MIKRGRTASEDLVAEDLRLPARTRERHVALLVRSHSAHCRLQMRHERRSESSVHWARCCVSDATQLCLLLNCSKDVVSQSHCGRPLIQLACHRIWTPPPRATLGLTRILQRVLPAQEQHPFPKEPPTSQLLELSVWRPSKFTPPAQHLQECAE